MYSNGKFKRGDSVLRVDGESFKHGDKMKYVYSITDKDSVQVSECSGIWKNEDIRHATPEEKYWMETLERDSIADFKHGDIFIDAEGAELILGGMWELNDATQWYKDGDFKGLYPAESYKRYPQEESK